MNYTSRDYEAIRQDIIQLINQRTGTNWDPTDYNDLGNVMVDAIAVLGDLMSYYIDRAIEETNLSSAHRTSTLLSMARLYGYPVDGPTPAQVALTFTNNGSVPIDLPIGTQVMAPVIYGPFEEVYFETTQLISQLGVGASITVDAQEGKTVNTDVPDLIDPTYHLPIPTIIGTTDGTVNQQITIYDNNIHSDSIKVYVGQGVAFSPWTYVPNLVSAGPQDHVFTTEYLDDGSITILFGDGNNGQIPPVSQTVSAVYRVSQGLSGNISAGAVNEVTFIPGNPDLTLLPTIGVSNTYAAYGGADADDLSLLRKKVSAALNTQRRAVTTQDFINLALMVSGVGQANAVAAVWSSVSLYIQPKDDGTYTPGVINGVATGTWNNIALAVETSLENEILLGTTVTVLPPVYIPIYTTLNILIDDAYSQSDVVINVRKALLSSTGFFSYANNTFGRVISKAALTAALIAIPGVLDPEIGALNTDNAGGSNTIQLNPNEIPYVVASNITINPIGGHA